MSNSYILINSCKDILEYYLNLRHSQIEIIQNKFINQNILYISTKIFIKNKYVNIKMSDIYNKIFFTYPQKYL